MERMISDLYTVIVGHDRQNFSIRSGVHILAQDVGMSFAVSWKDEKIFLFKRYVARHLICECVLSRVILVTARIHEIFEENLCTGLLDPHRGGVLDPQILGNVLCWVSYPLDTDIYTGCTVPRRVERSPRSVHTCAGE